MNERELLKLAIIARLEEIERLLTPGYKLTLFARYTGAESLDADILLTSDSVQKATEAMIALEKRPETEVP